jgi:hypothetical protein
VKLLAYLHLISSGKLSEGMPPPALTVSWPERRHICVYKSLSVFGGIAGGGGGDDDDDDGNFSIQNCVAVYRFLQSFSNNPKFPAIKDSVLIFFVSFVLVFRDDK